MGLLTNLLFGKSDSRKDSKGGSYEYPLMNDIISEQWKVKGKNPGTGRMRTVQVISWNQEATDEIIRKSGLTEPCEIEKIGFEEPTEKQLDFAKNIGIRGLENPSRKDLHILLSRFENDEPIRQEKAPNDILNVLIRELGIYIPSYAGEKEMNEFFYYSMKEPTERYAYFAMKVYALNAGKDYNFVHQANAMERRKFSDFAEKYKDDRSFVESFNRYAPTEISIKWKIKRKLKAYELANAFFYENL